MRRPPAVAPLGRARHAPNLVCLHVGDGWADALSDALHYLQRYDDPTPTLFLPNDQDPESFSWPVCGRNVVIIGEINLSRLRRLFSALLRDGAIAIAGIDLDSQLHIAIDRQKQAAA